MVWHGHGGGSPDPDFGPGWHYASLHKGEGRECETATPIDKYPVQHFLPRVAVTWDGYHNRVMAGAYVSCQKLTLLDLDLFPTVGNSGDLLSHILPSARWEPLVQAINSTSAIFGAVMARHAMMSSICTTSSPRRHPALSRKTNNAGFARHCVKPSSSRSMRDNLSNQALGASGLPQAGLISRRIWEPLRPCLLLLYTKRPGNTRSGLVLKSYSLCIFLWDLLDCCNSSQRCLRHRSRH